MIGHRVMGVSRVFTGDLAGALPHFDQSLRLYDPAVDRRTATFSREAALSYNARMMILHWRGFASWLLGHPEAALADLDQGLKEARQKDDANDLLYALAYTSYTLVLCRVHDQAGACIDELLELANKNRSPFHKAQGINLKGSLLASSGKSSDAVQMFPAGLAAWRSTGATLRLPFFLSYLARAYADIDQFGDATRTINDAIAAVETTKERWCEAEVHRLAGEIALKSPEPDTAKAEAHFERALAVARGQQAKSFELRAAMSMARLRRDQGKCGAARDLLVPIYGWFTEGFAMPDLREAKALLDALAS